MTAARAVQAVLALCDDAEAVWRNDALLPPMVTVRAIREAIETYAAKVAETGVQ